MAVMDEQTSEIAIVSLDCPDRSYPSVGSTHPPALRLERTVSDLFGLASRKARPIPAPGSITIVGACAFRWDERIDAPPAAPAYRFLPVGRRRPAPDRSRSRARWHHRTRAFPLHRQRRDRGPAGAAAGIYPQGDRRAHDRGQPGARRPTGRTRVGRQHRRLCLCVFEGGRSGAGTGRAGSRGLAARAAGRARTACQPSRRHRRHLQRRFLRPDPRPLRRAARKRPARMPTPHSAID